MGLPTFADYPTYASPSDALQPDPHVMFDCPHCQFVLRVYGPPLTGDQLDHYRTHQCVRRQR